MHVLTNFVLECIILEEEEEEPSAELEKNPWNARPFMLMGPLMLQGQDLA